MAELQNANPTILNLSELPTRRRQKLGHRRPDDDLTTFSPRPPHWEKVLHETYEGFESKSVSDSSDAEDPIDEQEIFGTCPFRQLFHVPFGGISAMYPCALCPAAVRHAMPWPTNPADFVSWLFRLLHNLQTRARRCRSQKPSIWFHGPLGFCC